MSYQPATNKTISESGKIINARVGIDSAHQQVHEGHHYFYRNYENVAGSGTKVYMLVKVGSAEPHFKFSLGANAEFSADVYTGPTIAALGPQLIPGNNNQNSSNTPVTELYSVAALDVTAVGTPFPWAARIGDGRRATVSLGMGYEIELRKDTEYLLELTKQASGTHYIDYDFYWYEGED